MYRKLILLFLVLTSLGSKSFATHIVGGEIYYDDLGGNNYKVTLKVYRDCYNGVPPLDPNAYIFIFNSSGGFIDSLALPLPGTTILPPVINNPCFTAPTDVCVEEGVYTGIINLPPIPGGYYMAYQRCCRNNSILNLILPGDAGSTYQAYIPDPTLAPINSSPRFNHFPPIFLCQGVPLHFDHSASDPDGDSLYYEFCDPFDGASPLCPSLGPQLPLSTCPEVAPPPPYPYVSFISPYSAAYPMASMPVMAINPHTGLMTGTPTMLGQWVLGVCVSEYRNGVLLDVNKRDFQFNVTTCPNLPVSSVPEQTDFCFGYQMNFTQNSLNATSYEWNFGDPTTTADVSSAFAPSWTYADSGTYTVTLIINPGTLCADTNTTTLHIQHLLNPDFASSGGPCANSIFNFTPGGDYQGDGTFHWNFGSNATPSTSSSQNPGNVTFNTGGTFPVIFTVTENGCTESDTSSVLVDPTPIADFGTAENVSCILNPVQFLDSSVSAIPLTYLWNFGNGNTSTLQNPVETYNTVATYNVSMIVTNQFGCKDTALLPTPLNVLPPPVAAFNYATHCFNNLVDFTETCIGGATYHWDFGNAATLLDVANTGNAAYTYPDSGTYSVVLTVNPGTSCTAKDSLPIFINLPLIPNFTAPPGECIYDNSFDFTPGGSYMGNGTFAWTFGPHSTPSGSSLENPTGITYDTIGNFPVAVTITENGCTASTSGSVNVYPKPDAFFEITTATGCALNPVHFIESSQSDTPLTYLWNFGDGTTSTMQNPYFSYADSGNYSVSLFITTIHGCVDTFDYPSTLLIYPSPVAAFIVSPTYTSIYLPDIALTDLSSGQTACSLNWGDGYISPNCGDTIHPYTACGTYDVTQIVVNQYACYDTAYAQVIVDPNYLFWIPNAFTPGNLDGKNDVFKPKLIGVYDYDFMIFNRWGEKLFETNKLEEGWNGIYKNNLCSQDVYVYKVTFRDDPKGNYHEYIGRVTLVR